MRVASNNFFPFAILILALLFLARVTHAGTAATNDLKNLTNNNTDVCLSAIEHVGHSRDTAAIPPLVTALADEKRAVVRRYLVVALGLLRDASAAPALTQALQDSDAQVRQSAVLALDQVGGDDAGAALVAQAKTETDYATKTRLVAALAHSSHPHADDGLKNLAKDKNPDIQAAANKALADRAHKRKAPKGNG